MASKRKLDSQDPHYQEGRRVALELKLDRVRAEARTAAVERKRARSVGDPPQTSKREFLGHGKPRGSHTHPGRMLLSSSVKVHLLHPQQNSILKSNLQKASERWKEARPHHLKCLTATEAVGQPLCWLCHEPAVIRECLPEDWFCGDWRDGYCIHEQACILPTVKAPDCSCEGTNFTILPGKPVILIPINGRFDLHQPLHVRQTCQHQWTPDLKDLLRSGYWPASVTSSTLYTPDLLNSFQELKVISPGFSRQAFAKLLEHCTKIGGRWTAARETSRRASKLDEEGMEVAVCRHGFLLKALNMYRGEIFAHPLYLQKERMPAKAQFFAMDIKWSGRNQEGAETTAGEEVEQVNSYLSRCALTTKYMSKAARVDMLTLHAMGWNHKKRLSLHQSLSTRYVTTCQRLQDETARLAELKTELLCTDEVVAHEFAFTITSTETPNTSHGSQGTAHRGLQQSIEGLYLSVRQRKQTLYRQNDSSKLRHRLRRKLAEDKKLLLQEIEKYNSLVLDSATNTDVAVVERSLTGESTVSQIWPWEVHGSANISIKKQLHDQVMQEEKSIMVLEMDGTTLHMVAEPAVVLKKKIAEGDKGNEGLCCLLRRRLSEVSERLQVLLRQYKTALGPEASALLHVEAEDQGGSSPDTSEDEEENTI
ncbi:hypothetical protein G5714_019103 [Onychostoma macrolepis]|uniref:CxC3 like cysteine cluster domain-containing protein n=1 Tax=Onychostoma macrolepis TaxID=369639 RepID=A0A7J6C0Y6_9TELE|nr:hypothetical protein G5714_019103 [Onychostoma macrolepis]